MELAAAASAYGNSVTLLGLEEVPLGAAIGPELGGFFRSLHEADGVRSGFRLGRRDQRFSRAGSPAWSRIPGTSCPRTW